MKRLVVAMVVAVFGTFVALFPTPTSSPTPTSTPTVAEEAVQDARTVAQCPWARTDASITSSLALAALGPFEATVTIAAGGEVLAEEAGGGLAFGILPLSEIAGVGVSSAVVEFSDRPSGAVVVGAGPAALVTAGCRSGASKVWLLAGGSTLQGESLELRLFNPFPQAARVEIRATSENDVEPEPALEAVTVNPRTTRSVNLSELLGLREVLAISITDEDGLVTPVLTQTTEGDAGVGDTAAWVGVGASSEWYFPFAKGPRTPGFLVLMNDGAVPIVYDIDAYTPEGSELGAFEGTLEPRTVVRIPVAQIHREGQFGLGISADGPMGAFLIGEGETQRAATPGATRPAENWLVPGPGQPGTRSTVWFLNSGTAPATVTYQIAQADGRLGPAEKLAVPIGTVVPLQVTGGIVVRSTSPISVGWVGSTPNATAFTMGLPFTDG